MDNMFIEKCKERCIKIINKSLSANSTFSVLTQVLNFHKDYPKYAELSPAFYRNIIDNCIQSLVVDICIMYDGSKRSESVHSLLRSMRKNIHLLDNKKAFTANVFSGLGSTNAVAEKYDCIANYIDKKIEAIESNELIIAHLKALRDKYYAHYDVSVKDIEEHFKNNKVSKEDFNKLLLLNINICNGILNYISNETYVPLPYLHNDFERTVKHLTRRENYDQL